MRSPLRPVLVDPLRPDLFDSVGLSFAALGAPRIPAGEQA